MEDPPRARSRHAVVANTYFDRFVARIDDGDDGQRDVQEVAAAAEVWRWPGIDHRGEEPGGSPLSRQALEGVHPVRPAFEVDGAEHRDGRRRPDACIADASGGHGGEVRRQAQIRVRGVARCDGDARFGNWNRSITREEFKRRRGLRVRDRVLDADEGRLAVVALGRERHDDIGAREARVAHDGAARHGPLGADDGADGLIRAGDGGIGAAGRPRNREVVDMLASGDQVSRTQADDLVLPPIHRHP